MTTDLIAFFGAVIVSILTMLMSWQKSYEWFQKGYKTEKPNVDRVFNESD